VSVGIGPTEEAPDYLVSLALPIRFNLPFAFYHLLLPYLVHQPTD